MTAPTLTPAFRDFVPGWIARQPWYRGAGVPATRPVGFFRLEDPAGEVGIETHLLTDGAAVYLTSRMARYFCSVTLRSHSMSGSVKHQAKPRCKASSGTAQACRAHPLPCCDLFA